MPGEIAAVIVRVLVITALGLALLRPSTTTTVSGPTPDFNQTGQVGFAAPGDCIGVIQSATEWPTGDTRCGPPGAVSGELFGTGRNAKGDTLVVVRFEVHRRLLRIAGHRAQLATRGTRLRTMVRRPRLNAG